jgi:hypothetical protein
MGGCGLDPSGSGQWLDVGPWEEHGDEHSGSIKCCEFLQKLNDYWFLKKDSALHSFIS